MIVLIYKFIIIEIFFNIASYLKKQNIKNYKNVFLTSFSQIKKKVQ